MLVIKLRRVSFAMFEGLSVERLQRCIYTLVGYFNRDRRMSKNSGAKLNRLKRIEGQVRGVAQMVEDDRYCMDILHQIAAIKSALTKVETLILKDHAACCVAEAIASGDEAEQREKFEELVDLLERTRS